MFLLVAALAESREQTSVPTVIPLPQMQPAIWRSVLMSAPPSARAVAGFHNNLLERSARST